MSTSLSDAFRQLVNSWPDMEAKCIADNLARFPNRSKAEDDLQERIQKVISGLQRAKHQLPIGVESELWQLDPRLRLRWDFDGEAWAVDRAVPEYQAWIPITFWTPDRPFFGQDGLIECLRRHDMQRFRDPKEYLAHKRAEAAKVRASNARAAETKMLGTIDGMTDRQVDQFMKVEQALQTGEKITSSGDDAAMLNAMYDATKAEQAQAKDAGVELKDNVCVNPGMKPGSGWERPDRDKSQIILTDS